MNPSLQAALESIYNDLEAELGTLNIKCSSCGTCCNFESFGHVLYASVIEVDYLQTNTDTKPLTISNKVCPYLIDNHCSIRKFRTLGCRVFFCDKTYNDDLSPDIYNKYYAQIKKLAIEFNVNWEYSPLPELLKRKQE